MRALPLLLASLLLGGLAHAQPLAAPAPAERAPLAYGLSAGPGTHGGMNGGLFVRTQGRPVQGSARLSVNELERVVVIDLFATHRDFATELAVLAGYVVPVVGRWEATASAGVSTVRVTRGVPCRPGLFCRRAMPWTRTTPFLVGFPVEVAVGGPVFGEVGLGLRAFGNVNPGESFAGVSVEIRHRPVLRPSNVR